MPFGKYDEERGGRVNNYSLVSYVDIQLFAYVFNSFCILKLKNNFKFTILVLGWGEE